MKEIGTVSFLKREAAFIPNARTGTVQVVISHKVVRPPLGNKMNGGVPSEPSWVMLFIPARRVGGA